MRRRGACGGRYRNGAILKATLRTQLHDCLAVRIRGGGSAGDDAGIGREIDCRAADGIVVCILQDRRDVGHRGAIRRDLRHVGQQRQRVRCELVTVTVVLPLAPPEVAVTVMTVPAATPRADRVAVA